MGLMRGRALKKARSKGDELLTARRLSEAYAFFGQAVDQFPEDGWLRVSFASVLLARRPDEAQKEAVKAAELGFEDPIVLIRAAFLLVGQGDIDNALAFAERAETLAGPDFPVPGAIDLVIGRVAGRERDFETAEARYRSAIAKEPADPSPAFYLAQLLGVTRRFDAALATIDESLPIVRRKDELLDLREKILAWLDNSYSAE